MSDPTSTGRLGVTVTARGPGFDFEGLEYEVPRAWHPAGIGPTAFLETLSAIAPVVEPFFIADARRLLPGIADEAQRAEVDAFLRQEAAHASMHAAFNRVLNRWDVPVDAAADSVLRWLAIVDWTSSDLRSAVAMAGEHFLGEIGNVILSRPELLDGVDPRIARLFRWHGYEEVEHKAVLFDAFHAARGRDSTLTPCASPGCGSPWSSSPSRSHRSPTASLLAPARRRISARGGTFCALSSDVVGCCGVDGARLPPTIGAISTRGGTSTTGASCRNSATRSSIPHGRSEGAEPPARGLVPSVPHRGRRPSTTGTGRGG
jgi:hypothetical protein